jgi:hypothetical protein
LPEKLISTQSPRGAHHVTKLGLAQTRPRLSDLIAEQTYCTIAVDTSKANLLFHYYLVLFKNFNCIADMGIKRKRSSEYSSSSCSSSAFSISSYASSSPSPSPLQPHSLRPDAGAQMELDFPISKPFRYPDDGSGRTRKRWRDRPHEHTIHGSSTQTF